MDEIKKIKKFIKGIIRTEPAILADWLEDRFVPGTDEAYKQEALASLRQGYVRIDIKSSTYVETSTCRHWDQVKIPFLRYGPCRPSLKATRGKLYMRSEGGITSWLFWFAEPLNKRVVKTVNPLLFALACLAYGWTTVPAIDRALGCLRLA